MIRSGANSNLVLSSLVFEYGCDAMVLLDSELTVRALNPAAQALLGWRPDRAAGRLDCRMVLGCRPEPVRPGADGGGPSPCLCERVMTLHRAVASARLRVRPHGRREMVVSASCSPLPVDHLGGAVLVLRALDDGADALAAGELRAGELRMDVARHQVYVSGRVMHVTPIEFDLLRYLLAHAGRVVSRRELLEHVWHYRHVDDRDLVKSHIASLRHRLRDAGVCAVHVENVYGVGYVLSGDGNPATPLGSAPAPGHAGDWW